MTDLIKLITAIVELLRELNKALPDDKKFAGVILDNYYISVSGKVSPKAPEPPAPPGE